MLDSFYKSDQNCTWADLSVFLCLVSCLTIRSPKKIWTICFDQWVSVATSPTKCIKCSYQTNGNKKAKDSSFFRTVSLICKASSNYLRTQKLYQFGFLVYFSQPNLLTRPLVRCLRFKTAQASSCRWLNALRSTKDNTKVEDQWGWS